MKVRRSYLYLALLGGLLLILDMGQRYLYVASAPSPLEYLSRGEGQGLTRALLVAGKGLDEAETATGLRDLDHAQSQILSHTAGPLELLSITPSSEKYNNNAVLQAVADSECRELLIYLTGHGGGKNFGAVGGLNITRDALVDALEQATFEHATVVIDCCWSGEFARSFQGRKFPGALTLITSSDAHHPSPFPVSFLSPKSFGHTLFSHWEDGAKQAFSQTNQERRKWEWAYGEEFGLQGTLTRTETSKQN